MAYIINVIHPSVDSRVTASLSPLLRCPPLPGPAQLFESHHSQASPYPAPHTSPPLLWSSPSLFQVPAGCFWWGWGAGPGCLRRGWDRPGDSGQLLTGSSHLRQLQMFRCAMHGDWDVLGQLVTTALNQQAQAN